MKRIIFGVGRAIGTTGRATVALIGIFGIIAALANYTATQGSGTTFGSIVVSTVHYAQQLICDSVTPSQCVAVKVGNTAAAGDVAAVVSDPTLQAIAAAPLTAGANHDAGNSLKQ